MIVDLIQKTDTELEDMLLDLCGRHELGDEEVELLQMVEEEWGKRFEVLRNQSEKKPN